MRSSKLIGLSEHHHDLLAALDRVAPTDAEVLITGPTGVGKELYARYLHARSARSTGEFVAVNCGALAADLLENELFGHVGGAFTGARSSHSGMVPLAERGTLFLDEVDALSLANQVKLLRFVQEKEYRRLGETRLRHADVRIVSASNTPLDEVVSRGAFREDLFYRLRVVPIVVKPLRERPEDVSALLDEYVASYALSYNVEAVRFSDSAYAALERYGWPGNVRELENCVRYLTCLRLGRPVEPADFPFALEEPSSEPPTLKIVRGFREAKRDFVQRFEREFLEDTLKRNQGNIARAAHECGKDRRAFFELLRKHNIVAANYRDSRPPPASEAPVPERPSAVRTVGPAPALKTRG